MTVLPFKIGYLNDTPSHGPASARVGPLELRFAEALRDGELDRPVEIVADEGNGLPDGSAHEVDAAWRRLADAGVLAVIGPAKTDNALAVRPVADRLGLVTMNWSGSERSRGEYAFHYQVGSLPDEGVLLAAAVAAAGAERVSVIRDRSPIGDEYWSYFSDAAERHGVAVASDQRVSPIATDLQAAVDAARAAEPGALVYLGFGGVLPVIWRAMAARSWRPPSFTNSAGLHWYGMAPEVRALGEGWVYVDMYDERNALQAEVLDRLVPGAPHTAVGGIPAALWDMGTLIVEGLRQAPLLTRAGVKEGLERVHGLPAACAGAGTVMGFGPWDRAALKGPDFLVLRRMGASSTERYADFPPSYERFVGD
jgi:ABC-type branched-subunit amino acid transport system substrate-binding protein